MAAISCGLAQTTRVSGSPPRTRHVFEWLETSDLRVNERDVGSRLPIAGSPGHGAGHSFKWIKQFYSRSEHGVKTRTWIALSVSVPVAIVRKWLGPEASLHPVLQVLSVTAFEKTPVHAAFSGQADQIDRSSECNQLKPCTP